MQLEKEMLRIGLAEEAQEQMRKMLCQKESNHLRAKRSKMDKTMFKRLKTIGIGAFGEVALVRKVDSPQLWAMKTLKKVEVLKRNQVAHVKAERDILSEADNEWVVKLMYSFQVKFDNHGGLHADKVNQLGNEMNTCHKSDFLTFISLQPNLVNLRDFKVLIFSSLK